MSDFNRTMAKEMFRMGIRTEVVHGNVIGNISPDVEWIKWLSYDSEF